MKPKVQVLVEVGELSAQKTSRKTGNPYWIQPVWIHTGDVHPEKSEQYRGDRSEGVAPGKYLATQVYLNQDGALVVDLRNLTAVKDAA